MPIQWRHIGEDPETGRWEVKPKGDKWRARKPDGTDLGLYDTDEDAMDAVEEALGGEPQEASAQPHKSERRAAEPPKHKGRR